MHDHRIIFAAILGIAISPLAAAQSIHDLRPPTGVPGLSPTAGHEALLLGVLSLEARQPDLLPILGGVINTESSEEEIATAEAQIQDYIDATVHVLVTGALLVHSETEPRVPQESLVAFMQGQVHYITAVSSHLGYDIETLYHGIALDVRYEDIEAGVQVALIGGYVQVLLLRNDRTSTETSVLEAVETTGFMKEMSELSAVSTAITDTRSLDWESLAGETIQVSYLDERLRLVDRTVTVTGYDDRFGVILPPLEDGESNVHVKISRIESVQLVESSSGN